MAELADLSTFAVAGVALALGAGLGAAIAVALTRRAPPVPLIVRPIAGPPA